MATSLSLQVCLSSVPCVFLCACLFLCDAMYAQNSVYVIRLASFLVFQTEFPKSQDLCVTAKPNACVTVCVSGCVLVSLPHSP